MIRTTLPAAAPQLPALRGAILQLLPTFGEEPPRPTYRRYGLGSVPTRFLLLPTQLAPMQIRCQRLFPGVGHASVEILEALADHPTPVAALVAVNRISEGRIGIIASIGSLGRREVVTEIYRPFPNGEGYFRHNRTIRAPRPPRDNLLEAALDLGLRRSS